MPLLSPPGLSGGVPLVPSPYLHVSLKFQLRSPFSYPTWLLKSEICISPCYHIFRTHWILTGADLAHPVPVPCARQLGLAGALDTSLRQDALHCARCTWGSLLPHFGSASGLSVTRSTLMLGPRTFCHPRESLSSTSVAKYTASAYLPWVGTVPL